MFVIMIVSLITSRVVFRVLGVEDFGINNIVGGIVILFSFVNTVLNASTQRFLNYEIGKGREENVNNVFCTSMASYLILSIVVIIIAETVGLWVLHHLKIPQDRRYAASWVYQFSVISFCIGIIRIPYNATIIAYEKMDFYAYLSIVEASLKLAFAFLLYISPFDKLISYSFLLFVVSVIIFMPFKLYCNRKFPVTIFRWPKDKSMFKPILSFSGWSLFGSMANIGATQGINIILNVFVGVTVNAAVGIGNQLASAIQGFVSNFQIAFRPQITKLYANGDTNGFHNLIFRASKISYFLFLVLAVPVIVCCPFIIKVWLGEVPTYSVVFCRLIIVFMMIDALSTPLWMCVEAIGKIKTYQIWISTIILINLPLAYLVLKCGFPCYSVWITKIIIMVAILIFRLSFINIKFQFPSKEFISKVILPVIIISIPAFIIPFFVNKLIAGWIGLIATCCVSLLLSISLIYFIGFNVNERRYIVSFIKEKINLKLK